MTIMDFESLERFLRGLMKGEFSSLHLTFNDESAPNHWSVEQTVNRDPEQYGDWISEEEEQAARATNSAWTLQWYPSTPNGFHRISASSLRALIGHVTSRDWD